MVHLHSSQAIGREGEETLEERDHPRDVDLEEEGVAFVVEEEGGVDEVVSSLYIRYYLIENSDISS